MPGLLHVYDDTVNLAILGAYTARAASLSVGVSNAAEFVRVMDGLVSKGKTFDAAVISTHGNKGAIWFGDDKINAQWWDKVAAPRGYDKLFPSFTRIYFPGCLIAGGEEGWRFLERAGAALLRKNGGITFAHDSYGYAVGGPIGRGAVIVLSHFLAGPFAGPVSDLGLWFGLKGKVIHNPFDDVRGVWIIQGGIVADRLNM